MHRNPANEDLSAYLDGELTDAEAAELEAELARDPALRADLAELEGVVQWMRHAGPDQAPMGFHHRVMARIEEEHPERPSAWAWLRRPLGIPLEGWLVAAAAAAVLLLSLPEPSGSGPRGGEEELRPGAADLSDPPLLAAPVPEPPGEGDAVPERDPSRGEVSGERSEAKHPPEASPVPSTPEPERSTRPAPAPTPTAPPGKEPPSKELSTKPIEGSKLSTEPAQEEPTRGALSRGEVKGEPVVGGSGEGSDPGSSEQLASPGYTYVVRSADPDMKRAVLALAGRYGGARDLAGREIPSSVMQQSTETLVVQVPQAELNAFGRALEALGFTVLRDKDDALLPGKMMPVRITLQLVGGSTSSGEGKLKSARQFDEMLEPSEAL